MHNKFVCMLAAQPVHASCSKHVDIGSGRGSLITKVKASFSFDSSACDHTAALMTLPGQTVDIANLNHEPPPYSDARLNVVTATEVT